jgi:hypothetical protein
LTTILSISNRWNRIYRPLMNKEKSNKERLNLIKSNKAKILKEIANVR